MKPTLVTTLCFFLFAFTTYFPLPFTQASETVKDIHGNPIVPSKRYFIWPNYFVAGGGLKLGKTDASTCPVTILQGYSHVGDGLPVKFTPRETISDDPISTGIELDIAFDENTPECAKSSKWVLSSGDGYRRTFLAIGLDIFRTGFFKFERFGLGYKLMFFDSYISHMWYDVVRRNDENGMRLLITEKIEELDDIFEFAFVDFDEPRSGRSVV